LDLAGFVSNENGNERGSHLEVQFPNLMPLQLNNLRFLERNASSSRRRRRRRRQRRQHLSLL
jgi:hypothetical protein